VEWLDEALDAYAGYGFNKAHATAYGVLAYVTAWYRANHPAAFWTGMLDAFADSDNEIWYGSYGMRAPTKVPVAYKLEAEKDGVQVLGPHVNRSKESWSAAADGSGIRTGLLAIKGVGMVASRELVAHAPYNDLADLAMRVSPRRVPGARALGQGHSPLACGGVIAALSHAGALQGLAPVPVLVPPPKKSSRKEPS
jgi:DNA polymerase-3 subunit alpha